MSVPRPPEPSTLIIAVLRSFAVSGDEILEALSGPFARPRRVSEERPFIQTRYYGREMGEGLRRLFCALEGLWDAGRLADLKLASNHLERRWTPDGLRRVNLDPGLVDLTHLVLATGKPAAHRIYVGQGIYGEVEYLYEKGSFRALPWTYPDYQEPWAIDFFNRVREEHRARIKTEGARGSCEEWER